ncbi:uncharacterized protein LOC121868079 [Homarus americanus]|uniref:uncharacterized protein LOC121868079 n=1 Tax=Homarus americanus TaxID=6706 RepID=UPI001C47B628|nr:uncharacterized protein LOC121868079 [Homarus americanus]
MHRSLPSRPEPQPLMWVMGVVLGMILAVMGVMGGVWWTKGRRSSHTLRNREDGLTKLNKPDVTGVGGEGMEGLCVNGVVQHTIYDSTGRYRGFAHLQQGDTYQTNCMITTTTAATASAAGAKPEPPAAYSKFSLSRKGRSSSSASSAATPSSGDALSKGAKDVMNGRRGTKGGEGANGRGGGDGSGRGTAKGGGGGDADEGNEGAGKKSEAPWRRVISQLTSPHESKFFEVWKIAATRQSRQTESTESVL